MAIILRLFFSRGRQSRRAGSAIKPNANIFNTGTVAGCVWQRITIFEPPSNVAARVRFIPELERLHGEIKRRTNVVGIFSNEDAITRLIGAILVEQNDEWAVQRARNMTLESIAPMSNDDLVKLPAVAA